MQKNSDVLIIGSGPAGLTAAIYAVRGGMKTTVLAGSQWGGQLMLTTDVENYPGFPEGIKGPELMRRMRRQAERLGAEIIEEDVAELITSSRPFRVVAGGKEYFGQAVIIATGAITRWLDIPGEKPLIGRGVSSCAPCDAAFFKDKRVVVVGGGDAAMEEASVLAKFAREVTIIHRRDAFRASKAMQDRVLARPNIRVLWNTTVGEIVGKNTVERVRLETVFSPSGQMKKNFDEIFTLRHGREIKSTATPDVMSWEMPVDGVFVAVGHDPLTHLIQHQLKLDTKGYIKRILDPKYVLAGEGGEIVGYRFSTMTSVKGIFAAGDVHDFCYRQAVTAAGYGCEAALEAARWLEEKS